MPYQQGIDVSLRSQHGADLIREYPLPSRPSLHPKTSSSSLKSATRMLRPKASFGSFRLSKASNESLNSSSNSPVKEVFVEASPSAQFWIRYHVEPPRLHSQTRFYYFKLLVEGKCIVSWGIGREDHWRGATVFGLFDAGEDWRGRQQIEKRGLFFPQDNRMAGGASFEMQVFRAKARKSAATEIRAFKDIGLSKHARLDLTPAGNVKRRAPKSFYTYALTDPADQPYAVFRYHYRTKAQLKVLGIGDAAVRARDEVLESHDEQAEEHDVAVAENMPTTGSWSTLSLSAPGTGTARASRLSWPPWRKLVPTTKANDTCSPKKDNSASNSSVRISSVDDFNTLYINEASDKCSTRDWIMRTPSPVKNQKDRLERTSSPPSSTKERKRGFLRAAAGGTRRNG